MMQELQDEFRSATPKCASFCPSPVVGHVYAAKLGIYWSRVLIEDMEDKRRVAYQVDKGHRHIVLPSMMFHLLPDRFMELPAQAIRCILDGVFLPSTTGSFSNKISNDKRDASYLQSQFLGKYIGKPAVAFFTFWQGHEVGFVNRLANRELTARAVLYPKDDIHHSINMLLAKTPIAQLRGHQIEFQEHYEICKRVVSQNPWSAPSRYLKTSSTEALVTEHLHLKHPIKDTQQSDIVQDISIITDDFLFATSNYLPNRESRNGSTRDAKSMIPTVHSSFSNETYNSSLFSIDFGEDEKRVAKCSGFQEEETIPVTFVYCQSPINIFFRTPELVKKFIRLQSALRTFFSARKIPSEETTIIFSIGLIYAVHYEGEWFRAEIVDIKDYPNITVSLLDVGCFRTVSSIDLHHLPEELTKLSKTVLCCSLHGIAPLCGTKWDVKATQCVTELLVRAERIVLGRQKDLNRPKGESLPVMVYVYGNNKDPAFNLNTQLVALGLASLRQV